MPSFVQLLTTESQYDNILSSVSGMREAAALRALMLEVFRLNGALIRHGEALTVPLGQTQARWQVIGAVGETARTVPQIARRMGMSRQGVQRVADLLARDGLISFDQNPITHVRRCSASRSGEHESSDALPRWAPSGLSPSQTAWRRVSWSGPCL